MNQTRTIRHAEDWVSFCSWMQGHPSPYPFRICPGAGQSLSQNALIHMHFGQIAAQRGDVSLRDVKGEMHYMFALPIRRQDAQFSWIWEKIGADQWPDEKQCKLLASGLLSVSSGMTPKQLSAYQDALYQHATEQGWSLVIPDEAK